MTIHKEKGFTLIETIIYVAMFSMIIGGGVAAAYQMIQSTDSTSSRTILEQEANFILRKLDWALTGATLLATPAPQPKLVVTRSPAAVTFTLNGTDFQKGGVSLNSLRVTVSSLSFQLITVGAKQGVVTKFTATTRDGKISQPFTSTKYLR